MGRAGDCGLGTSRFVRGGQGEQDAGVVRAGGAFPPLSEVQLAARWSLPDLQQGGGGSVHRGSGARGPEFDSQKNGERWIGAVWMSLRVEYGWRGALSLAVRGLLSSLPSEPTFNIDDPDRKDFSPSVLDTPSEHADRLCDVIEAM